MKTALLTIFSSLLSLIIFSQHIEGDTLYYGSEPDEILNTVEYAVVIESMYPDNMNRLNLRLGAERSYRTNFIALSYLIPGRHYFEVGAGLGAGFLGTYLFHTREVNKLISQRLEVQNQVTVNADIPIVKQKNFGLRYGFGYYHLSYRSFRESNSSYRPIKSTRIPLTIGISRFNITHGNYRIYKNPKLKKDIEGTRIRGQRITSLNLDAVFFPKYFHSMNEGWTIVQDESISLSGSSNKIYQSRYEEIIENTEDEFGLHASIQGTYSFWSKTGDVGFKYNLGLLYYPMRASSRFDITAGLGLVWFLL
jgi:hypothetical protein